MTDSPPRNYSARRGDRPLPQRLALRPDEAAACIGISRRSFDQDVLPELRVVRRGHRVLVPIAELERWLERNAARPYVE